MDAPASWWRDARSLTLTPAPDLGEKPSLMLTSHPDGDQGRANGAEAENDSAHVGLTDSRTGTFADTQQAGLAAAISLARVPKRPPAADPGPPLPEPPPTSPGLAAYSSHTEPIPVVAKPPSIAGRRRVAAHDGPHFKHSTKKSSARLTEGQQSPRDEPGIHEHTMPIPVVAQTTSKIDQPSDSSPGVVTLERLPAPMAAAERERRAFWGSRGFAQPQLLLLIAILTIQSVLSLRLVWSNTAAVDEATYLWAGHLEIGHWLHGTPVPPFQTWFSGAPIIYPPIGALAGSASGLVGARLISLVFMGGVTVLLWGITAKLFDSRAAFFATALFATLAPTQFLGALATYDAMALFLIAVSAWCVVSARDHDDSTSFLVVGAIVLALANATKYATLLFDPVVVILAALVVAQERGTKPALGRAGYLAACVTAIGAVLLAVGGPFYTAGVFRTSALVRTIGDNSPVLMLEHASKWVGVVCVLAWLGVLISLRGSNRTQTWLLALLATAGVLAPLGQGQIPAVTSLPRGADYGAWLAAPAAGYALARISRVTKRRILSFIAAGLIAAVTILPAGALGSLQAAELFHRWPNSSAFIAKLRAAIRSHPGEYLAENYTIPAYYLEDSVPERRWSNTWLFSFTTPGTGRALTSAAAYRAAIARHYFSLVLLDFSETPRLDNQIVTDMHRAGGYQIVALVPSSSGQYIIWADQQRQQPERRLDHR
jgi:4-amino-4-deoxy-L-arabinose transferase-like glycosyltransferase